MYRSYGMRGGDVKQAAMEPMHALANHGMRANGLILSGVVVATYVPRGDTAAFAAPDGGNLLSRQVAVYCDVLVYSSRPEMHSTIMPRVLVAGTLGLHDGHVWFPRAAKLNMQGKGLGDKNMDPRDLDGDHVVVQFVDDNLQKPIITGRLPHPRASEGNENLPDVGHRMLLDVADGNPDLWKHHGSFYGVDNDGNFVVNTTRAHSGKYDASGKEQPAKDADHGQQTYRLPATATWLVHGVVDRGDGGFGDEKFRMELKDGILTVRMADDPAQSMTLDTASGKWAVRLGSDNDMLELDATSGKLTVTLGGAALSVEGSASDAAAVLGDGAVKVAIADVLQTLYSDLKQQLNTLKQDFGNHTHTCSGSISDSLQAPCTINSLTATPPTPSTAQFPEWDPDINADRLKIPSN